MLLAGTVGLLTIADRAYPDDISRETDLPDPGGIGESIDLTGDQIERIEDLTQPFPNGQRDASLYPVLNAKELFQSECLKVAGAEADAGISRTSNRARVAEYLGLFGLDFADASNKPYAYCASGISWAACRALCNLAIAQSPTKFVTLQYDAQNELAVFKSVLKNIRANYFRPNPQVEVIAADARKRGSWQETSVAPVAGWLIFYNWNGGKHADHIGIVSYAGNGALHTIEFNTAVDRGSPSNGGAVARKDRSKDVQFVIGYAKLF